MTNHLMKIDHEKREELRAIASKRIEELSSKDDADSVELREFFVRMKAALETS